MRNTIIAGNTDVVDTSEDCEARTAATSVKSEGYNLIQNTTNCVITGHRPPAMSSTSLHDCGLWVITAGRCYRRVEPDSFAIDAGQPLAAGRETAGVRHSMNAAGDGPRVSVATSARSRIEAVSA